MKHIVIASLLASLFCFQLAERTVAQRAVSYSGPIIDVHLHTEPPLSMIGQPNPVTGVKGTSSVLELRDPTIKECDKYHIVETSDVILISDFRRHE